MGLISYDTAQFERDVAHYVDISPVFKELDELRALKIWEVVTSWKLIKTLTPEDMKAALPHLVQVVKAACSCVELAKIAIVAEADPDGSKGAWFDSHVQLATAVKIVLGNLHFNGGWLGSIAQAAWKPAIAVLIGLFVAQMPITWGSFAVEFLKLVVIV